MVSFALVSMLGFRVDETYSLNQNRKLNDVETYRVVMAPIGAEMIYDSKFRFKTVKINADGGFDREETLMGVKTIINGTTKKFGAGDPTVRKYTRQGVVLPEKPYPGTELNADSLLQDALYAYIPKNPVNIGDRWGHGGEKTAINCQLVGKEKVGETDCVKIDVTVKLINSALKGNAKATLYVRAKDFSLEKIDAMIESPTDTSGTVTIKRTKFTMERISN